MAEDESYWSDVVARLKERAVSGEVMSLARSLAGSSDTALACEVCRAWLPSYVDAEMAGLDARARFPQVAAHLGFCPECEAEYAELLTWAMEEERQTSMGAESRSGPKAARVPALPLVALVRSLAERLAEIVTPHSAEAFAVVADRFFRQVGTQKAVAEPRPTLSMNEPLSPLLILSFTYHTTRQLVRAFTLEEIEAQQSAGTFLDTVRKQAVEEARIHGLPQQEAERLAASYAAFVGEAPAMLARSSISL